MPKLKTTESQKKIIANRVKYLRRLGAPVTAARGYDLRTINNWTYQRFAALDRFADQLDEFIEDTMPITGAVYVPRPSKPVKKAIRETFYKDRKKPKWLKGEIIPNMGAEKISLKVDKEGNLIYRDEKTNKFFVTLDPVQLATRTKAYFREVFEYMVDRNARAFVLKAGNHYFRKGGFNGGVFTTEQTGLKLITSLMSRYGNYNDWLHTIEAHVIDEDEYQSRAEASAFVRDMVREHNEDRDAIREQRKKDFRRQMRKRNRKKGATRNIV